jgi:hypothetical protein
MQKYRIQSLRFLFVFFLISGFGGCCDEQLEFWNIVELDVELINKSTNQLVDTSLVVSNFEEFQLVLLYDVEYVATVVPCFTGFLVQNSYAFQCPDMGGEGMKDPIVSLNIYSNNEFNAVSAGESLNDFIVIERYYTVEEFVLVSATSPPFVNSEVILDFTIDPNASSHIFTVEIETESGITFEDQTFQVTWN